MEHTEQERLDPCPVCGGRNLIAKGEVKDYHLSQEVFTLSGCLLCGFLFTDPRPKQEFIGRYYASENYISHSNTAASLSDRLYRVARNWALRKKHGLVAQHARTGRLLDVGCGTGSFLGHMIKHGYHAVGVEPSERARSVVDQLHPGSTVADMAELDRRQPFDMITLWHVLEHLPDLQSAFGEFHSLLRPSGHLIIAVPDRTSWDCVHYGAQWAAWDVPRHLSHFQPSDLSRLFQKHGFETLAIKRMWLDAPYICMLSERYRGKSALWSLAIGMIMGSWSNLNALLTGRSTSSTLYIALKA